MTFLSVPATPGLAKVIDWTVLPSNTQSININLSGYSYKYYKFLFKNRVNNGGNYFTNCTLAPSGVNGINLNLAEILTQFNTTSPTITPSGRNITTSTIGSIPIAGGQNGAQEGLLTIEYDVGYNNKGNKIHIQSQLTPTSIGQNILYEAWGFDNQSSYKFYTFNLTIATYSFLAGSQYCLFGA